MFIKIFFNDKPLFLCDAIDEIISVFIHHDDTLFIDELDAHSVRTMIHEMEQPSVHAGVFYHDDLDELKNSFLKKFFVVRAAGGLVRDDEDKILMIFRRGKWDLPKGKLDQDEKMEDCALREVREETGLRQVTLVSPLVTTYHTYHEGTKHILKETHWFSMEANGKQVLAPQTEEDISEIRWVAQPSIPSYLARTFPLISDVMVSAKQKAFISF